MKKGAALQKGNRFPHPFSRPKGKKFPLPHDGEGGIQLYKEAIRELFSYSPLARSASCSYRSAARFSALSNRSAARSGKERTRRL